MYNSRNEKVDIRTLARNRETAHIGSKYATLVSDAMRRGEQERERKRKEQEQAEEAKESE